MGDNIRPALYEARYEAFVANRMNEKATEMVTIAGKYCESGDILVKDVLLPPIGTDGLDLIAIPASGAYCLSMASNYNLNPKPPIVLVNNGSSHLIRRRETYKDQMLLDVL
jgi:diaminopimelate decarboxylase